MHNKKNAQKREAIGRFIFSIGIYLRLLRLYDSFFSASNASVALAQ